LIHLNCKKIKHGIGLSEIKQIKMCCYKTVVRNKKNLDIVPDTKPLRYVLNDKILNWYPEYEKGKRK